MSSCAQNRNNVNLSVSKVHSDLLLKSLILDLSHVPFVANSQYSSRACLQAGGSCTRLNTAAREEVGSLGPKLGCAEEISKHYYSTIARKFASPVHVSLSDEGVISRAHPVSFPWSLPSGLLLPEQDKELLDTKDSRQKGNMFQT